jgi:hypothetical protein
MKYVRRSETRSSGGIVALRKTEDKGWRIEDR